MIAPSTIIATIRDQVYEPEEAFYTTAELYRYLSEAEALMADAVKTLLTNDANETVIGTREYTLPSDCVELFEVTYNEYKLQKIGYDDLIGIEGNTYNNEGQTGEPAYYYEQGGVVGLSPIPVAEDKLIYKYQYYPTALTSDSTTFSLKDLYVNQLVDYVLYRCYYKDDKTSIANNYYTIWNNNLTAAKNRSKQIDRSNHTVIVKEN